MHLVADAFEREDRRASAVERDHAAVEEASVDVGQRGVLRIARDRVRLALVERVYPKVVGDARAAEVVDHVLPVSGHGALHAAAFEDGALG